MIRPLDRLGSIKTKLGVLVAVTVAVAATLSVVGARLELSPVFTIPGAVLVALVVTQILASGMTSPLREMTAAARTMATGNYSRRVRATSRDEVGELARAFNTMAADLEAVDRQRRDLVANVSHELRTPVSALRAVLENLVDGVSPPDRATLQAALEQTERLGRLVTDLLDLSRVDAGLVPLVVEATAVTGRVYFADELLVSTLNSWMASMPGGRLNSELIMVMRLAIGEPSRTNSWVPVRMPKARHPSIPGTVTSRLEKDRPFSGNCSMRARSSTCPSVGRSSVSTGVTSCTNDGSCGAAGKCYSDPEAGLMCWIACSDDAQCVQSGYVDWTKCSNGWCAMP